MDLIKLIKRKNFNSSELIDLLASHDTLVKKITCDYLLDKSSIDSNLGLLTANVLLRDCNDANPTVRRASLLALSNLSEMGEAAISSVSKALGDSSPQVRRIAAHCCVNIYNHSPESCLGSGLIDLLYEGIRDSDPIAITNCLLALEKILRNEGGFVINKNITHHLLERISQFSDCSAVYILNILKNYVPKNEEEIFYVLNALDPCLNSSSPSVLVTTVQLFVHLTTNYPHLIVDLFDVVKLPFCKLLSQSRAELCFFILKFLLGSSSRFLSKFCEHYKYFLIKSKDPSYLKKKKFQLLPMLTDKSNVIEIISEVRHYASDFQSYNDAFKCIGAIGSYDSEAESEVFLMLSQTIKNSNDRVVESALECLLSLLLRKNECKLEKSSIRSFDLPDPLCRSVSQAIARPGIQEHKPHLIMYLLHFLAPFVDIIQDILEDLSKQMNSWDLNTRLLFITSCCVSFLHWPPTVQPILSSVLSTAMKAPEREVSSHAMFVYAALKEGPKDAFNLLSLSNYFPLLDTLRGIG